ncbi:MAG: outer membrane lipoprotein-sorting protein [Fimbriimonadales bacterium]|nr:outer membrane lipoprotein-sorting protein [Fimbriimonadales bacterium]
MNTMRFCLVTLGIASLVLLQPTAQQSKPQSAQQVLDRMAQAAGLTQAAKIRSWQLTGTIQYPQQGLQAKFESFYKAPNKYLAKINIPQIGEIQQGYDGKVAWEKNPMTGLRELKGAELAQMRQSAEAGAANDFRKMLRNPQLAGEAKVGNRNAIVIKAQSTVGGPMTLYIDSQRYLPLRVDMETATPQGKISTTSLMEDYRRVDGVMYPFTVRQSTANIQAILKLERVRHNVSISDAIFRKPKS